MRINIVINTSYSTNNYLFFVSFDSTQAGIHLNDCLNGKLFIRPMHLINEYFVLNCQKIFRLKK